MYQLADFVDQVALVGRKNRWALPDTRAAELNAIAGLLASDPSRRDSTVETPPAGLRPGNRANKPFTNQVLLVVNRGKGGNLLPLDMGNAITGELSKIFPPVNTSAPVVSGATTVGATLTCTNGNWTYVPTSYTYQWMRGAVAISGATAATHVIVAGDQGTSVTCQVTAHNAAGASMHASNAIAVP